MFKSLIGWFKALSMAGKSGVLIASVLGLGAVSAATGNNQQTPISSPKKPTMVQKSDAVTHKTVTTTESIPFTSSNVDDATLAKDTTKVITEGVDGVRTHTFDVIYKNGVEDSRMEVSNVISTQPTNKVVAVGTYVAPQRQPSNCNPNYSPCVPNVSYDLDCPDIGQRVTVIGYDQYRLDADHDGIGCESY